MTARISSPGDIPAFSEGVLGRVCSTTTRPGSTETTRAEAFLGGRLHLLELIELAGIEEDRMRIEMAQQSRNRAPVKSLIHIERIGGILLEDLVCVDEFLHQARVVVFRAASAAKGTAGATSEQESRSVSSALSIPSPDYYRVNRVAFFAACRSSASSIRRSINSA